MPPKFEAVDYTYSVPSLDGIEYVKRQLQRF
jgi:hypothetical protein